MPAEPPAQYCYRHPQVATWVRCQRCQRPICPACMIQAAVGFQCPECVSAGMRQTRQNVGPFGGARSKNPLMTTYTLIGINVLIWVPVMLNALNGRLLRLLALTPYGVCVTQDGTGWYPGAGPAACSSLAGGIWDPGVATGGLWQVLTSAFTHQEIYHIGFNMVALWFLGPQLERVLGRARFLALYLISALGGSAAVMWFSEANGMTLGASGAVYGMIGALAILAWRAHGDVRGVLTWLGLNLVFSFVMASSVSWQGHIGGLVAGLVVTAVVVFAPRQNRATAQWVGLGIWTALLIALIVLRCVLLA